MKSITAIVLFPVEITVEVEDNTDENDIYLLLCDKSRNEVIETIADIEPIIQECPELPELVD